MIIIDVKKILSEYRFKSLNTQIHIHRRIYVIKYINIYIYDSSAEPNIKKQCPMTLLQSQKKEFKCFQSMILTCGIKRTSSAEVLFWLQRKTETFFLEPPMP